MSKEMRQITSIIAAALVLAYVGTVSVSTGVRDFAPWPADLFWLAVVSAICGALLVLSTEGAAWAIVVASMLAVLIFAGLWSYVNWVLVGKYIPLFDLIISDLVSLYVFKWGLIILIISIPSGLIGAVIPLILLPDDYFL